MSCALNIADCINIGPCAQGTQFFYFPGSSTGSFSPYLDLWFRCFCSSSSLTATWRNYSGCYRWGLTSYCYYSYFLLPPLPDVPLHASVRWFGGSQGINYWGGSRTHSQVSPPAYISCLNWPCTPRIKNRSRIRLPHFPAQSSQTSPRRSSQNVM